MEVDTNVLSQARVKIGTRLICFRRLLVILLDEHHEDEIIYAFMTKDQTQIKYIEFDARCKYLNFNTLICYKSTIKKLFLYLIYLSYPNIPRENIIVIANRILKRRSVADCAKLLHMSNEEYQRIEDGTYNNFNLKQVAKMLNFKVEEFYYGFHTTLERYEMENDRK